MSHTTEQDIALIHDHQATAWHQYQQHQDSGDYEIAELWFQQWLIWHTRLHRYTQIMAAYI
jgi:hypothetical protein